jgi:hypothetical protein
MLRPVSKIEAVTAWLVNNVPGVVPLPLSLKKFRVKPQVSDFQLSTEGGADWLNSRPRVLPTVRPHARAASASICELDRRSGVRVQGLHLRPLRPLYVM